ncbi:hypothetical protein [Hymenobacter sp. BT730]|uniref:hypothetical protein n=1 Tax=Hymenobacter sp. BT730 TaxID=3063332 RepID=UPI0026DF23DA|nr:hypothetical protein [Hymenobacter sp. BT730]
MKRQMEQLLNFAWLVLRLMPALIWWAVAVGIGCFLNLLLLKEIWPNTPQAEYVLVGLMAVCALLVPWLAGKTANRVAQTLQHQGSTWYWLWRLLMVGSFAVAAVITLLAGVLMMVFVAKSSF